MTTEVENVLQKLIDAHPKFFHGKQPQSSYLLEGWYKLVDEGITKMEETLTEEELEKVDVGQIKEKFGALRFYVSVPERTRDIIKEMSQKSSETCEICGEPGKLLTQGWMSVRCDKHSK